MLLIAVAALAIVLAWAAVAFTQEMMRPDGRRPIVQTDRHGHRFVYTYVNRTLTRNGKLWVTIKQTPDGVEISDPNGTGQVIVTVYAKAH